MRYAGLSNAAVAGPAQFTVPYGIGDGMGGGGNRHAIWLQRYMHDYGATREELYQVIHAQRKHAALNPVAFWRDRDLSLEEYLNGRWIYEPISIFDCDIPVTGAGALVMTTAERARDLPHRPAYVAGYANSYQPGDAVFQASGVPREDVQVLQLYDGYSPFVYHWLEFLGFCGRGEAHTFIQDGRTELGGALPMNTFGGSLGEGRSARVRAPARRRHAGYGALRPAPGRRRRQLRRPDRPAGAQLLGPDAQQRLARAPARTARFQSKALRARNRVGPRNVGVELTAYAG